MALEADILIVWPTRAAPTGGPASSIAIPKICSKAPSSGRRVITGPDARGAGGPHPESRRERSFDKGQGDRPRADRELAHRGRRPARYRRARRAGRHRRAYLRRVDHAGCGTPRPRSRSRSWSGDSAHGARRDGGVATVGPVRGESSAGAAGSGGRRLLPARQGGRVHGRGRGRGDARAVRATGRFGARQRARPPQGAVRQSGPRGASRDLPGRGAGAGRRERCFAVAHPRGRNESWSAGTGAYRAPSTRFAFSRSSPAGEM